MATHQDWTEILPNTFDARSAWGDLMHMWLPERAFAQSAPPTLKLTTAGNLPDDDGGQTGVRVLTTFESGGRAYAAIASSDDDGIQILDLTDPYSITIVDRIIDTDDLELGGACDMAAFESDGRTYGAVASYDDDGVQILDLTDPHNVTATDSITDDDGPYLDGACHITTFESDGSNYAAVISSPIVGGGQIRYSIQILDLTDPYKVMAADGITDADDQGVVGAYLIATFEPDGRTYGAVLSYSDDSVQILDLTDPYNITVAGGIADDDDLEIEGARSMATFESGGHIYAAVARYYGVQILDLTDPYNVTAAGSITDDDRLHLGSALDIATFESGGRTYGAVLAHNDDSIQILDLTDPYNITTVGSIADTDDLKLSGAWDIAVFWSGGRTYGAVGSYDDEGVQILDLTDPYNVTAAGSIVDYDSIYLGGANHITTFESNGRIYGAVASYDDDGVQILDLTDPYNVTAAGNIADDDDLEIEGARSIATFESDGRIYGAVGSFFNDGVQILDLTDPYNVTAASNISYGDDLEIEGSRSIATFESDGRTYAAVVWRNGVQILDLTDPYSIAVVGNIADDDSLHLGGALDIAIFESDGRTYAVLTSRLDGGAQILDLTDPYNIVATDGDHDDLVLEGATHMATFESDGRTYGAVAAFADDGVQILDLTDPYNVTATDNIADTASLELEGARGIATFESDGRTYGAVGSFFDDGVQILDFTDPYGITIAGSIADDDSLHLDSIESITTFESDERIYAVVTSRLDGGVQILDLTDPYSITAVSSIVEGSGLNLHRTYAVVTFESDGHIYAAVVWRNGVQILDLTDPYSITAVSSIAESNLRFDRDSSIITFESDGRIYAALTSRLDDGVQILDLTDPYSITATDGIVDDDGLYLQGAAHIATFESDGRTYAAIVSVYDGGVQILDLTDPYSISPAGSIAYNRGFDHITTFESDGRAYAAVYSYGGDVQILDLTDPYSISPAGSIKEVVALSLYSTDYIATFESDGRAYAAVISASSFSYDIQILDLTDPYSISPASYSNADGSPTDIAVLELDDRTYAAIALRSGGINIFDLTDPYSISRAGGSTSAYGGFYGITSITTFELDGNTYLAVTSPRQGVQTLQVAAKEPDACVTHTADADTPAIPPEIAATGNRFAVDFYRQISGDGDNVFFSPISVYVAFSMVGEAAREETASQLQDVFGFSPDEGLRHNATSMLMSSLNQPDPCATLQMASSLWLAEQFEPYDSYVGVIDNAYQADIETVDFQDGGVDRINDWAAEKTQGTIPKVLDPDMVPENTTSAILNAIYFKGSWEEPFPVGNTHESDFWTGTQEVKADFMAMTTRFGYTESDGVQVLSMPYQGDRLSMLVMLPSDRDGLDHLERIVTPELIEGWQESLRSTLVRALVPKFEMNTHYNLTSPLVNMGVEDVFDPRTSDLSGMAHLEPYERLYVNIAIQDAYVKVNEEGTEAAAVTTIGVGITTSLPPEPVPFIADHPFLFLIQDDESGTILFMGRVSNPS